MKIAFFYEFGTQQIGMGHKYRSQFISYELIKRGHTTTMSENCANYDDADIIVIDHLFSQKDFLNRFQHKKLVLIDGSPDDVDLVDLSISAFYNNKSTYAGSKYVAIPPIIDMYKYSKYNNNKLIFVGMGGLDANNYAEIAIKAAKASNMDVLLAKSINHPDYSKQYSNVILFEGKDYYDAMKKCIIGIVNGGLTLFQAINFGLPVIAVPQYEHQQNNIDFVQHCCIPSMPNDEEIKNKIGWLMEDRNYRGDLSNLAKKYIDGAGIKRTCDLIEALL